MRRWLSVMAVSALVAGLVVIWGSPASASVDDCPMGYVCLFEHSDARGTMVKFTANQNASDLSRYLCPVSHCWHGGANFNDDMSSWVNNSGIRYCWYFDSYFRGSGSR